MNATPGAIQVVAHTQELPDLNRWSATIDSVATALASHGETELSDQLRDVRAQMAHAIELQNAGDLAGAMAQVHRIAEENQNLRDLLLATLR